MEATSYSRDRIIAIINYDELLLNRLHECNIPGHQVMVFKNGYELYSSWKKEQLDVSIVISCSEIMGTSGIALFETLTEKKFADIPFLIYASGVNENLRKLAMRSGIADVFATVPSSLNLETRICFLIENWSLLKQETKAEEFKKYRTPFVKRVFDVFFASLALVCLSPLFLIVAILLRLESKGPVFYYSLRVGTGYRLFKFYKFRSMYVNADARLKDLKHLNQYNQEAKKETVQTASGITLCNRCAAAGNECMSMIYADKKQWCEKEYNTYKETNSGSAFIKIKNDPRITKVGNVIRNLSIDELPQLWNVVIGDMSIVGNRPLPLYEAERLTTDKYVLRFMAPAGMTGLWQVEKRGKGEMSEEERLMLDNVYAENHSFLKDIKLIFKTVPALFQKENV